MKKIKKILLVFIILIAVLATGAVVNLKVNYPKFSAASELKVSVTPERIARGKYLANHVTVCLDCHSKRDWKKYSGPPIEGTEGQGGEAFTHDFGFPGSFYSRNITPNGISGMTDSEVLRAFTEGVDRNGNPFFPVMPYPVYAYLSKEDAQSIVAYIRTLKPIGTEPPKSDADFPMSLIMRTIPKPAMLVEKTPTPADGAVYGRYVITVAGCAECHTKQDHGQKLPGMDYAGGFEFNMITGMARSANITPDKETGIGSWTKEQFIARFKAMNEPSAKNVPVAPGEKQTVMPWTMYAGMTDTDLGAIYDFLRTVTPVANKVETWTKTQ